MNTICTAVLALALGGILSEAGFLHTLVERITGSVRSDRAAILVTLVCGILTVMLVTNFYVSAVLMGTMFRELYDRRGIHRSVLSRTIEEANTIILPLVPWNTGCIYYMGLFGFTTLSFAPYVVFALSLIHISAAVHISAAFPIITRLLAAMNLTNVSLFAATTAGTLAVFAAVYAAVYVLTSRVYFKIVS